MTTFNKGELMFNYLLKGILSAMVLKLLDNYRHLSMRLLKIEFAKSYLHGVRIARLSAIVRMQTGLIISLICLGTLLFHFGLFILLPWTVTTKAVIGMFLGVAYVVTGGVALRAVLNEKTWMEKSGASEILRDATCHSNSHN